MKKKILAVVLSCLLAFGTFGLIACVSNEAKFQVDVFIYNRIDEYGDELAKEIVKQVGAKAQVNIHDGETFDDADGKQAQQIENVLNSGTDLIIAALADYSIAERVAQQAQAKGVQVIFSIREPYTESNANALENFDNTSFVGIQNDVAGILQGQLVAKYLTEGRYRVEEGTTVNYIQFRGDNGNPAADARSKNVIEQANLLLSEKNITLNPIEADSGTNVDNTSIDVAWNGDFGDTSARGRLEAILNSRGVGLASKEENDNINMIIGNSDDIAIGAITALQTKDWNKGNLDKTIPVFGMDALTNGKQYVKDGMLTATLEADLSFNAKILTQMINNVINGAKVAKDTIKDLDQLTDSTKPGNTVIMGGKVGNKTLENIIGLDYFPYSGNLSTTK